MDKENYKTTSNDMVREYTEGSEGQLKKVDSPIQTKLEELEKSIVGLGERVQIYINATVQVRKIVPTAESAQTSQDEERPRQSEMAYKLDQIRGMVTRLAFEVANALDELEL